VFFLGAYSSALQPNSDHLENAQPDWFSLGSISEALSVMSNLRNRGVEDILIAVEPSHGLHANHCWVMLPASSVFEQKTA